MPKSTSPPVSRPRGSKPLDYRGPSKRTGSRVTTRCSSSPLRNQRAQPCRARLGVGGPRRTGCAPQCRTAGQAGAERSRLRLGLLEHVRNLRERPGTEAAAAAVETRCRLAG
jgi:hypothetical protein